MDIHSPLIEYDCNQILYNIFFVLNTSLFQEFLYSINYTTIEDINILKDKKIKKVEKTINSTIKLLYDNIEDKLLEDFIEEKFDI